MRKGKAIRLAGFVGALCASAVLIGTAVGGTGAYFTSTSSGTISGNSGSLTLSTSSTNLNFANLMPGDDQTENVTYTANVSSGSTDLWLVFPDSVAYEEFTGAKGDSLYSGGGLGRYGHFAVANNGSTDFQSRNLQLAPPNDTVDAVCPVDGNGDGGSNQGATSPTDTPPLCGVPGAILLASGLTDGSTGTVSITFGLSGKATGQNQALPTVGFNLVSTQHGIRPDAQNF